MAKTGRRYFRVAADEEQTLLLNAKNKRISVSQYIRVRTVGVEAIIEDRIKELELKLNKIIILLEK
ncbi:MAG: hypothetical protein ABIH82_05770 [Candidatus Woesearchaeota archaeon]